MRIVIGADHAGYDLKEFLKGRLQQAGHQVLDVGTNSTQAVDYPDIALKVCTAVITGKAERGIMLGGSGQGEAMAPNKLPGIRAALCHDEYTARMSREHNDANVLSMGARVVGPELAWSVLQAWLAAEFSGDERHKQRLAKVQQWEQKGRLPLLELAFMGQSIWLDNIHRGILQNGEFRKLVRHGVLGVTSNPSIFEKAFSSEVYLPDIRSLSAEGKSPEQVAESLMIADIREACDQLAAVYDLTDGRDGYVSLELAPSLTYDTPGSVAKAKQLFEAVDRPNVMIKVVGSRQGIQAYEELITAGVQINVTLLFSVEAYEAVARAYINAIERRAQAGQTLDIMSVASFFVSRIDTLVDSMLDERLKTASGAQKDLMEGLKGKVAIANAKIARERYHAIFGDARWKALEERGARPQRLLWGSTSTKNPAYRDVMYIEELIGDQTVNTVPDATIKAYIEHGFARPSLDEDLEGARQVMAQLAQAGIDMKQVTDKLLTDGVKQFGDAYDAMVKSITAKQQDLQPAGAGG